MMRPSKRPGFLTVSRVLSSHGLSDDGSGRSHYRNYMKRRIIDIQHSNDPMAADEQWQKIRRGWAYGTDEFRLRVQDLLDKAVSGKRRDSFMGEEIRSHDEQEAEKLIQQGLDLFGIAEENLLKLKKGDDRKKVISWYIRKKNKRTGRVDNTAPQHGCHIEFFPLYSRSGPIERGSIMQSEKQNDELGGLTRMALV